MKSLANAVAALIAMACAGLLALAWVFVVLLALTGSGIVAGMFCIAAKTDAVNRWLDELTADDEREE